MAKAFGLSNRKDEVDLPGDPEMVNGMNGMSGMEG